MIKVKWKCRHYLEVYSDIFCDPDDCYCSLFITEVDERDWDKENAAAICPKCGFELTQKNNSPEVVS